jgi:hypothetical protein
MDKTTYSIQNKRKYNAEFRKKIINKIDKLNNKNDYISIYNIIIEDIGTNYSSNRNGIFINLNILSDKCIDKILNYVEKHKKENNIISCEKIISKSYIDEIELMSEIGHKLSNHEKNIMKKFKKLN